MEVASGRRYLVLLGELPVSYPPLPGVAWLCGTVAGGVPQGCGSGSWRCDSQLQRTQGPPPSGSSLKGPRLWGSVFSWLRPHNGRG